MELYKSLLYVYKPTPEFVLREIETLTLKELEGLKSLKELSQLEWLDKRPLPSIKKVKEAYKELSELGIDPTLIEHWPTLKDKFTKSNFYKKVYFLVKLPENRAAFFPFNILTSVIFTAWNKEDLTFYLNDLIKELGNLVSEKDVAEVNKILLQAGFDIVVEYPVT